jgi:hypothetical protein
LEELVMPVAVETPQSVCRFGLARADITPPVGIYHRMWGAAAHDRSTGVHRPLFATAFVMGPQEGTADELVILALDHCVLLGHDSNRLRERVASSADIDPARLLLVFSHTHAAGLMDSGRADRPGGDLIAPYLDRLAEQAGTLVAEARAGARPATLSYGVGRCSLAANRDFRDDAGGRFVCGFNPGGPADDTIIVVRATDEHGQTLATLVNYACHPTTLAWQNTLISPDFPGAMREVVELQTGSPCIFLQGASGDLGPREGFVGDPAIADRNGRQLGYAALEALEALSRPKTRFEYAGAVESGAVIGTWHHATLDAARLETLAVWRSHRDTVDLAYRPDVPTVEAATREQARWREAEESARTQGDLARAAECRAFVERMERQALRARALPDGPHYPLLVELWRAGDALWLAVEGEPYQALQTELRRRFPATPIVVMTLLNGGPAAYLPTSASYGHGIYEEQVAVLAAGCLERLIDAVSMRIEEIMAP